MCVCIILIKTKQKEPKLNLLIFLTYPLIGNIIFCCMEENENMCSLRERETLGKKSSFNFLLVVTIYYVWYPALRIHWCKHFLMGTFQLERSQKKGCMLLFLLFLRLEYNFSKATSNAWCPATSTSKECIFTRVKS